MEINNSATTADLQNSVWRILHFESKNLPQKHGVFYALKKPRRDAVFPIAEIQYSEFCKMSLQQRIFCAIMACGGVQI